jgi:hypothetical protein
MMALSKIDYYVLKPWRLPDEYFHRTMSEFLLGGAGLARAESDDQAAWARRSHNCAASWLVTDPPFVPGERQRTGRRRSPGLSEAETPWCCSTTAGHS